MEQKQTNLDRYNDTRMAGGYKDAPDIIPVTRPALTDFTERMSKELQMQNEIINSIQSGLHNILDRREPENKDNIMPQSPIPPSADVYGKLVSLQRQIESNNKALERIVNHLSEII